MTAAREATLKLLPRRRKNGTETDTLYTTQPLKSYSSAARKLKGKNPISNFAIRRRSCCTFQVDCSQMTQ